MLVLLPPDINKSDKGLIVIKAHVFWSTDRFNAHPSWVYAELFCLLTDCTYLGLGVTEKPTLKSLHTVIQYPKSISYLIKKAFLNRKPWHQRLGWAPGKDVMAELFCKATKKRKRERLIG